MFEVHCQPSVKVAVEPRGVAQLIIMIRIIT